MLASDITMVHSPGAHWLQPLICVALAGCAAAPRRAAPPLAPPPDAAWLIGDRGVRLYTDIQVPATPPAAAVYFVLGAEATSLEAYPQFLQSLRQAGIATAVLHARGTGFSDGLRGDLDDFELFLKDQRLGLEHLRKEIPGVPVFLFGHSAGAMFALELGAHPPFAVAGMVLVNPAYKMHYGEGMGPSAKDYVVYALNYVLRPSALTVDMNSSPERVRQPEDRREGLAMQQDPLVVRYFSMRFMFAQKKVMDRCLNNVAAVHAPLLLVQGSQDSLVDPSGNTEILQAAPDTSKTLLIAPLGGHGASAVETKAGEIVAWLREHSAGARQP